MSDLTCTYDILKEGVYSFMKNFFLYLKFKSSSHEYCNYEDVHCFENNKILAVSRNTYNAQNRAKLQKNIGMQPYYITQNIFKEFLQFILNSSQEDVMLMGIQFVDKSIEDSFECLELQRCIDKKDIENAYKKIFDIMDLYDTDIESLKIRYNGYDFYISSKGVIDTNAPTNIFKSFIEDSIINKIMLGIY